MNGGIKEKSVFLNLHFMWVVLCSSNSLITQNILSLQAINIVNFIIACIVFFYKNKGMVSSNKGDFKLTCSLIVLMFTTILFTFDTDNIGGYLLIVLQILQMFFLVNSFSCDEIQSAYVNTLLHIAASSIIVTYIMPIGGLETNLPRIVNTHGLNFNWFLFAAKLSATGSFGVRNYGIFSEPAAYCFYLFIAMYFTLRLNFNLKRKAIFIFLFAFVSFTTMSPIGTISGLAFILIIGVIILKEGSGSEIIFLTVLFVVTLLLLSLVAVFNDAYYFVLNKTNINSGSGLGRSEAVFANLKLWLNRPVFGNGLKGITSLTQTIGSNTSTSGVMLACFGTVFSLIVFVAQGINIWQSCNMKTLFKIIVVLMFFLVINNYGFIQAEWYWFFCFKLHDTNMANIKNREID